MTLSDHSWDRCRARVRDITGVRVLGDVRHLVLRVDGRQDCVVLKIHRGGEALWRREVEALDALATTVPGPACLDSWWEGDVGGILFEHVAADSLAGCWRRDPDHPDHALVHGAQLARRLRSYARPGELAALPVDPLVALGLGSPAFVSAYHARTRGIAAIVDAAGCAAFDAAIAHAARALEGQHTTARHIHGDLQPKNLLVDGDTVVAVIDWELARWSLPICDVATVLRHARHPHVRAAICDTARDLHPDPERACRAFDLLRVGLGLASATSTGGDVPLWTAYLLGCAEALLEGTDRSAKRAARALLTLQ